MKRGATAEELPPVRTLQETQGRSRRGPSDRGVTTLEVEVGPEKQCLPSHFLLQPRPLLPCGLCGHGWQLSPERGKREQPGSHSRCETSGYVTGETNMFRDFVNLPSQCNSFGKLRGAMSYYPLNDTLSLASLSPQS